MATGPGHIGYDVFDKFIKLLLEEIMGAFFAPLLVIAGAKLYFLGAVLPFALVYFRRWARFSWRPAKEKAFFIHVSCIY